RLRSSFFRDRIRPRRRCAGILMSSPERSLVFGLRPPLVLAHRGGAGEVPESTEEAFRYAVDNGMDMLELDLRLTRARQVVVWHGPGLDRVYDRRGELLRKRIEHHRWKDLAGNAWVVHPHHKGERGPYDKRTLLRLEDLLRLLPDIERSTG